MSTIQIPHPSPFALAVETAAEIADSAADAAAKTMQAKALSGDRLSAEICRAVHDICANVATTIRKLPTIEDQQAIPLHRKKILLPAREAFVSLLSNATFVGGGGADRVVLSISYDDIDALAQALDFTAAPAPAKPTPI
jgi:hypothetical protein